MKDFDTYCEMFACEAQARGLSEEDISLCLCYASKLNDKNVPVIYDQEHLANMLGMPWEYILRMSNSPEGFYTEYRIPKKHGGKRIIMEPFPDLKDIQTWILENILNYASKTMVSPVAKAFVPGKSLRENARFHKGYKVVVALDVENFFPSIHYGEIYGVFRKIGYTKAVSTVLANLCVLNDSLPQGAPTSPMLSNMIFKSADDYIWHYCRIRDINYTRYADDLTFSGDVISIPHLISYVQQRILSMSLVLNKSKTKVMRQGHRQNVTGAVVNDVVQVRREYRNQIRQEMYYYTKFGLKGHMERCQTMPKWVQTEEHYLHHLLGKVNYVLQINPKDEEFLGYAFSLKEHCKRIQQSVL